MRRWLKRAAFAVGWGACTGLFSLLWKQSWEEAVSFGVSMGLIVLAVWGVQDYVDRNPRRPKG
ncbi:MULTISPECIES: hypothetical protein [Streptomyces]|uniref:Uncharacterized protein n=1 Tax=Streptomyces parvulus TaxID=146923 RepID=A0ABV5DLJ3_9ACTN